MVGSTKLKDQTSIARNGTRPHLSPGELREGRQWVCWRWETRDGEKPTKVPCRTNGSLASTKNPKHWSTFDRCVAAYEAGGFDGVGFVFAATDPYCGVDLDHCVDEKGEINDFAKQVTAQFPLAYVEYSPSGTGVHIICKATRGGGRKGDIDGHEIEVYDRGRYFTMTGKVIQPAPEDGIGEHQAAVEALVERMKAKDGRGKATRQDPGEGEGWRSIDITVNPNAEPPADKFLRLMHKRGVKQLWDAPAEDESDRDYALCKEAFKADWSDQEACNLLVAVRRKSDSKGKIERDDYYKRTIYNARAETSKQGPVINTAKEAHAWLAKLFADHGRVFECVERLGKRSATFAIRVGGETYPPPPLKRTQDCRRRLA